MHFSNVFISVLLFLSISSIASPLSPPTSVMLPVVNNGLDVRQLNIASIIIEIAYSVIKDIIIDIVEFKSDMHAAETNFTQQTLISLNHQFPGKNLLVYHDQKSRYAFSPDAVHVHQELNIGLGFTRGYEIWVFDTGTFSLAGEAGYENWAIRGCFSRPSVTDVVFRHCSKDEDN